MVLNSNITRGITLAIPTFTALLLFGGTKAIFDVGGSDNLFNTGITLNIIFAILNLILLYFIKKRRMP